jgi:hypothetical protein
MALKCLLDHSALDASSASVNQTNLVEPRSVRGADVLRDDRCDVARRERVKVDRAFDGNVVSHVSTTGFTTGR